MNNKKNSRTLIIILAVISIGLLIFYAVSTIGTGSGGSDDMNGVANYGSEDSDSSQNGSFGGVTVVSGSDGIYTVTDDGTLEMDSIPNGSETPAGTASNSDS